MKISNQTLYDINKNEYHAQQESTLKDAMEMGLTEDEATTITGYKPPEEETS